MRLLSREERDNTPTIEVTPEFEDLLVSFNDDLHQRPFDEMMARSDIHRLAAGFPKLGGVKQPVIDAIARILSETSPIEIRKEGHEAPAGVSLTVMHSGFSIYAREPGAVHRWCVRICDDGDVDHIFSTRNVKRFHRVYEGDVI